MTDEASKRKEEFIRRQKGTRTESDIVAQRLTNIYRQLGVLGDKATERFNQQLIHDVNPDILTSLKAIPGGEEVRDYYNFLTHTETEDDETTAFGNSESSGLNALLPKPEQLSPIWETFGMGGGTSGVPVGNNRQNPIQMAVVNPIRASVVTTSVGGGHSSAGATEARPLQSAVDFATLQRDILDAMEKQHQAITQALNFIVIDSNIEKMHQNLKHAISAVTTSLEQANNGITTALDEAAEKASYPSVPDDSPIAEIKVEADKKSISRHFDKMRKAKRGQKFSVDMEDGEED